MRCFRKSKSEISKVSLFRLTQHLLLQLVLGSNAIRAVQYTHQPHFAGLNKKRHSAVGRYHATVNTKRGTHLCNISLEKNLIFGPMRLVQTLILLLYLILKESQNTKFFTTYNIHFKLHNRFDTNDFNLPMSIKRCYFVVLRSKICQLNDELILLCPHKHILTGRRVLSSLTDDVTIFVTEKKSNGKYILLCRNHLLSHRSGHFMTSLTNLYRYTPITRL